MAGSNAVVVERDSAVQVFADTAPEVWGLPQMSVAASSSRPSVSLARPEAHSQAPVAAPGRIPLVLLIGDCAGNALHLASTLRCRYRVMIGRTVEESHKILGAQLPDLVVTEHRVGQGDVPQRWTSGSDTSDVPVLYLASPESLQADWDHLGVEGNEFIVTPIIPHVLFARVRTLLRMKRQADLLRKVARLDVATLIANRGRFESQLDLEWRACQRAKTHLGVVLVSVDHFQNFVRRSGQQTGEEAMAALAQVLSDSLRRPRDFVARYGHEEFVVLLPGSDEESSLQTASYLCSKVARAKLPYCGDAMNPYLSISAGAASLIPEAVSNPRRLMKAADDHLYIAMMSGRNQARSSSQSTKPPLSGKRPIQAR